MLTKYFICYELPQNVTFATPQTASFFTSNYGLAMHYNMAGKMSELMRASIWNCCPAAMFETVQHVYFRIARFGLESKLRIAGSAPALITHCVCSSVPAAILPIVRMAGSASCEDGMCINYTTRGTIPASTTRWTRYAAPSLTYDNAHSASITTCSSCEWSRLAKMGKAGLTRSMLGCGLPRHKLERAQTALRLTLGSSYGATNNVINASNAPDWITKSRQAAF